MKTYSIVQPALASVRPDFQGSNDPYSKKSRGVEQIVNNLTGTPSRRSGFLSVGRKVSQSVLDSHQSRLNRYQTCLDFYEGNQFATYHEDGLLKIVTNYCGLIADIGADWFAGKGHKISAAPGNEKFAEMMSKVIVRSGGNKFLRNCGLMGAVSGDIFYFVETGDNPLSSRLILLDSSSTFPTWDPQNPELLTSVTIQYPVSREGRAFIYSLVIDRESWEEWEDEQKVSSGVNTLGLVPVIHVKNKEIPERAFGCSDIEDIAQLNLRYNEVRHSLYRVIEYQGEPTTLVYGVRASTLERGANRVWSNIPPDAKIENLDLTTDLSSFREEMKTLRDQICEISETPRHALDASDLRISNTSGMAMQMMYAPLIRKTSRKVENWEAGMRHAAMVILTAMVQNSVSMEEYFDSEGIPSEEALGIKVYSISPLPKDEQLDVDIGTKKVEAGIWSKQEFIRRSSGVEDMERLAVELAADKAGELAYASAEALARKGEEFPVSSAFLGSEFLDYDFSGMAQKVVDSKNKSVDDSASK